MKVTACLFVLIGAIVLASAEECRDTSQCGHVTCPENNYSLECHRGTCTCTQTTTNSGCTLPTDCTDNNCDRDWHCVDGRCRCGFGFGGK